MFDMTASRVFRSSLRAVPAALIAVIGAVGFAAAGGVAIAQPVPGIPSIPAPAHRLQILPGQNSTGASGSVVQGKSDQYSIASAPGQTLSFDIASSTGNARVSVAPLIGPMAATEVPHAVVVADGNDYQVLVTSADGSASDYTLTVTAS
jgi:hypothetical protein